MSYIWRAIKPENHQNINLLRNSDIPRTDPTETADIKIGAIKIGAISASPTVYYVNTIDGEDLRYKGFREGHDTDVSDYLGDKSGFMNTGFLGFMRQDTDKDINAGNFEAISLGQHYGTKQLRNIFVSIPFPKGTNETDEMDDRNDTGVITNLGIAVQDLANRAPQFIHCGTPEHARNQGYHQDAKAECNIHGTIDANGENTEIDGVPPLNYFRLGRLMPWYTGSGSLPNFAEVDFRGRGYVSGFIFTHVFNAGIDLGLAAEKLREMIVEFMNKSSAEMQDILTPEMVQLPSLGPGF